MGMFADIVKKGMKATQDAWERMFGGGKGADEDPWSEADAFQERIDRQEAEQDKRISIRQGKTDLDDWDGTDLKEGQETPQEQFGHFERAHGPSSQMTSGLSSFSVDDRVYVPPPEPPQTPPEAAGEPPASQEAPQPPKAASEHPAAPEVQPELEDPSPDSDPFADMSDEDLRKERGELLADEDIQHGLNNITEPESRPALEGQVDGLRIRQQTRGEDIHSAAGNLPADAAEPVGGGAFGGESDKIEQHLAEVVKLLEKLVARAENQPPSTYT